MTAIDSSFDLFSLTDEHHELRSAIRALTERDIVPHAADCDENERFPSEALDALNQSGFNAVHVPDAYGGQGADAVATCIVIEEVARGCCSSSLIPAVNKLGTMGLILSGAEDLKQQVLPDIAAGAMASYALSEREAGSDTASMRTRARAEGDGWILNGTKCWITNGGKSTWYTVMAVTDPDKGANGISAFMVHKDDEGFSVGPKERKMGIKGSPTTELYFENCRIPGDRIIGEPGTGLKTALKTLDHTRPTVGAQAVGMAQGALDAAVVTPRTASNSASRYRASRPSNSAGRHGDEGGGRAADGVHRGGPRRARRARPRFHFGGRQVLRLRRSHGGHRISGPVAGRRRIYPRLSRRADDARRQDHPDLRGHQPNSAHRDVPRPVGRLTLSETRKGAR